MPTVLELSRLSREENREKEIETAARVSLIGVGGGMSKVDHNTYGITVMT